MTLEENKNTIINRLDITEYHDHLISANIVHKNKRLEYFSLQAKNVNADYFYCYNNTLEENKVPFIYVYDQKDKSKNDNNLDLVNINKQLWTLGEVALAIIIYKDEIVIIDTRKHIEITDKGEQPAILEAVKNIDDRLKKRIFEAQILEESDNYKDNSPYELLLKHIEVNILDKESSKQINCSEELLRKILIKFIFIKYLEEQTDSNGSSVFSETYFTQYLSDKSNLAPKFCDVIRDGDIVRLLQDLSAKFNGGIFKLTPEEETQLNEAHLQRLATALDGRSDEKGQLNIWRYYDFNLLPIEFISRLYETFIISVNEKSQKERGAYYTPPHLARLLIDELLPFDKQVDFDNFRILDPTCGSGVFLALAYKRLITLWLLPNKRSEISGIEDINAIKKILTKCIYGIDINADALSITATSLQIELCSHIQPKDIWNNLQFDNLCEEGNLTQRGFFKWYKTITNDNKFDIIVGNPPFNLAEKDHQKNIEQGLDEDYRNETYEDFKNKFKKEGFPTKNPALTILYKSLENLLKDRVGTLFLIMPASSFLYMFSANNYRQNIAYRWNIRRIYDFTPLRKHLWGKKNVATIAVKIDNRLEENSYNIQHVVVRNSYANEKGAIHFMIDKYDRYYVPIDFIFSDNKKYIWKINLLGGGRLELFIEKIKQSENSIGEFFKKHEFISKKGFERDKKFLENEENKIDPRYVNLKNKSVIDTDKFIEDIYSEDLLKEKNTNDDFVRNPDSVQNPPNILIRLNQNHKFPIIYNNADDLYFAKGVLGIKSKNIELMESFVDTFRQNKAIYCIITMIYSPQSFTTQEGSYTINKNDLLNLPLNLDNEGIPIPFGEFSSMDKAILEDTELIASNLMSVKSRLYEKVETQELLQYEEAFCETLNLIYENGDYKFRTVRRIVSDDIVWLTFEHTSNNNPIIERKIAKQNNQLYKEILSEEANSSLTINRIITSYNQNNCISFIKPNKLKYWMRTIAYRDVENVKADMYKNGY